MIKRNICVVTSHVPMVFGGHLIIAQSLVSALKEMGYNSDVIYTPQNRFGRQLSAYLANRLTDVGRTGGDEVVDQIISLRYPSYAVKHPLHVCWLNHRMRESYDLWEDFLGVIPTGKGKLKERFRRRLIQRLDNHLLKRNVKSLYVISGTIKKRLETWGGDPFPGAAAAAAPGPGLPHRGLRELHLHRLPPAQTETDQPAARRLHAGA